MGKVYSFSKQGKYLILTRYYEFFSLDNDEGEKYNNVLEYFSEKDYKLIDNTFSLQNSFNIISFEEQYDLLEDDEYNNGETISFIFGVLKEDYYKIIGLDIDPTIKVYFSKDIVFKPAFYNQVSHYR